MADGFDDVFVASRRQLRGVAESLIAGPQYRASGTIRLAVRPDGFSCVTVPVGVHGTELVWPQGSAPLVGPVSAIAEAVTQAQGPGARELPGAVEAVEHHLTQAEAVLGRMELPGEGRP